MFPNIENRYLFLFVYLMTALTMLLEKENIMYNRNKKIVLMREEVKSKVIHARYRAALFIKLEEWLESNVRFSKVIFIG